MPVFMYLSAVLPGLIFEGVNRCRDTAGAVDEPVTAETADGHDRRAAEQAAEFQCISLFLSDRRDETDRRRLAVDHADGHLVRNDAGNGRALRVARDGDHIQTDRAYAGHGLQLFDME